MAGEGKPVCGDNFLAQAQIFYRMQQEGWTVAKISSSYGVSDSYVRHSVRLLDLPGIIQEALKEGKISSSQALAYLELKRKALMSEVFSEAVKRGEVLSRRDIKKKALHYNFLANSMTLDEERLREVLGTVVQISGCEDRGIITIRYQSKESSAGSWEFLKKDLLAIRGVRLQMKAVRKTFAFSPAEVRFHCKAYIGKLGRLWVCGGW